MSGQTRTWLLNRFSQGSLDKSFKADDSFYMLRRFCEQPREPFRKTNHMHATKLYISAYSFLIIGVA